MRNQRLDIAWTLTILFSGTLSILVGAILTLTETEVLAYVFLGIGAGALSLYIAANLTAMAVLRKKEFDIKKYREGVLAKKEALVTGFEGFRKTYERVLLLGKLYLCSFPFIVFLANAGGIAVSVVAFRPGFYAPKIAIPAIFAVLWIWSMYSLRRYFLIRYQVLSPVQTPHVPLSKYEYPKIWDAATRAMKATGPACLFRLIAEPGCNVRISQKLREKDNAYEIAIGNEALRLFDEAELYAVFLHEFAHANAKHVREAAEANEFLEKWRLLSEKHRLFPAFLFIPISVAVDYFCSVFFLLTSYKNELEADKAVKKPEDIGNFINSVAKLDLWALSGFELPKVNTYSFEGEKSGADGAEKTPRDFFEARFHAFKENYKARKEKWDQICLQQLPARIDTHPNLPERMKNMGAAGFDADFSVKNDAYTNEIRQVEKLIYDSMDAFWADDKKYGYLKYKETIEKFEASDGNADAETANAYFRTCDYEKAEKIYSELAEANPQNIDAGFHKGLLLCDRYDDAGIDVLMPYLDTRLYGMQAYMKIIMFLTYEGNKERRDSMRETLYDKLDKHITRMTAKKYKFLPHSISEKAFDRLRCYIKDEDGFLWVFALDKRISGETNNSLFVCFSDIGDEHKEYIVQHLANILSDAGEDIGLFTFDNPMELGKPLYKKLAPFRIK